MKRSSMLIVGAAIAALCAGCPPMPDPPMLPFEGYAPVADRGDGWDISTPETEGMDPDILRMAFDALYSGRYFTARSLLVVKNGKLVAESYCHDPEDIGRLQCIWSATKSFTSIMVGIAMADGRIGSIEDPVYRYIGPPPDGDARKQVITIRDCLTMTTGLDYLNDGEDSDNSVVFRGIPDSLLGYVWGKSLKSDPGAEFLYKESDPDLAACAIAAATGESLAAYADEKLFAPLGIRNYRWEGYKDGTTYGAYGLWMTPRDMAKFGLMVLDRGMYDGRRIVTSDWIDACLAEQVGERLGAPSPYGYLWWVRPHMDGFCAAGHGGQYIYLIPGKGLAIVFTAMPDTVGMGDAGDLEDFEAMIRYVVRAAG